MANQGGDPYDITQLGPEEKRLFSHDGTTFGPSAYAYPPIFTTVIGAGVALGEPTAYTIFALLMLGM